MGMNIARLSPIHSRYPKFFGLCNEAIPWEPGIPLDAGDVFIVKSPEHVVCVSGALHDGTLATVEGGQPDIKDFHRTIVDGHIANVADDGTIKKGRQLVSVVTLEAVLRSAFEQNKLAEVRMRP